jgi:hypothetical protein
MSSDQGEFSPVRSQDSPRLAAWAGVWIAAGAFTLGWMVCIDRFGWIGGLLGWWPSSIAAALAGAVVTVVLSRLATILSLGLTRLRRPRALPRAPGVAGAPDSILERSAATASPSCDTSLRR